MFIFADKIAAHPNPAPAWLIEPYLPREGVVLLYGKKGTGKSPLTWAMAQAVATGVSDIFTVRSLGKVLYIEVDSPFPTVQLRAPKAVTSERVCFYFPEDPLICLEQGMRRLAGAEWGFTPVLVIFNTLRKIHPWDDKVSETPSRVYGAMRGIWPHACLLFVHHEKKDPTDHYYTLGEEYSGSLAWHNDSQVAMRLSVPSGRPFRDRGQALVLSNTGNQLGAKAPPLKLILGPDGAGLSLYTPSDSHPSMLSGKSENGSNTLLVFGNRQIG